jgi:HD-GYP domain-containing protein (c-di-GMP phosphodiesterase class II)
MEPSDKSKPVSGEPLPSASWEDSACPTRRDDEGYLPIRLASLRVDAMTGFDLYLPSAQSRQMVLYQSGDSAFTEVHRERLSSNCVEELYIAVGDRKRYLQYVEGHLNDVLHDETIPREQRAKILYSSASLLIEDVFADPTVGASIARAHEFVDSTVDYLFRKAEHFTDLLEIMSFDYHTYTHSVNVCIFGVALARRLGYGQRDLNRLGAGLLLHDAGKSVIDASILSKRGPLSPGEWEIIKTHPARGVELLGKSGAVEPESLQVVQQHHEKCSGRGYPSGLTEKEIHSFAKIAAVADVFDALTTERTYKRAVAAFPAIRIMQIEMADSFDRTILREMIMLLHTAQDQAGLDISSPLRWGLKHTDAA